ncbi:MAG: hypothetical protein WKH64_02985 [Chloroflexia bacterium]
MGDTGGLGRRPRACCATPARHLMLGHMSLDTYVGLLPVLYPILTGRFDLDLKTVGLVTLAYSGSASLSQPFFGWLADRYGTRLIGRRCFGPRSPLRPLVRADLPRAARARGACRARLGRVSPAGALSARAVIPEAQRNTAMSVYVTAARSGWRSGR